MQRDSQKNVEKPVFFNLGLFQFLSFVRRGIFYTFMISYLYDLMQTVTYTTLLGSFNMFASALGQNLLWGKIADRYKLRAKLVIIGELTAAGFYFIVFQIHKSLIDSDQNFAAGLSLIFGLSLLEFFWSTSDVGWAALLTDVTTSKTRAGIVGTLNFIASLGRMIGINFAGYLYGDGQGFRQGTLFYIVIAMLLTSTAVMAATSRFMKSSNIRSAANESVTGDVAEKSSGKHGKKTYSWFLISMVIIVIGAASINQIFLLFLRLPEGLHAGDPETSFILTAWTLGGMLASPLCGWIANRAGKTKVLLAGLVLAVLTPMFYASIFNVSAIALIYGLNGVAFWTIQTVGFAYAGDIIPEDRRGRLFGLYNTVMALSWGPAGLFVGGPLADIQTQVFGLPPLTAYANTFLTSAVIVSIGAALFVFKVAKTEASKP